MEKELRLVWTRTAGEMKTVAADKITAPKKIVYKVYRGAESAKDKEKARKHDLRYDLTYLYPGCLNKLTTNGELSKTFGHYHNKDYPEITEVISGTLWFLIQRYDKNPRNIKEVYLVEAQKGEKVISPPYFGHISINPSKTKTLITCDWLSLKEKSDYKPYEKLHGACYYAIRNAKGNIDFQKNKNYAKVPPKLIRLKPKEVTELGTIQSKSLYSLIKTPDKLEFLNNPKKYKKILTIKNCYKKI